ncbi:hypothetical protein C8R47DRAFT_1223255 [Mycena vitilis]|nr:hypothetical protein C8R47DRAFT_1223255 [Mycena vitilis]
MRLSKDVSPPKPEGAHVAAKADRVQCKIVGESIVKLRQESLAQIFRHPVEKQARQEFDVFGTIPLVMPYGLASLVPESACRGHNGGLSYGNDPLHLSSKLDARVLGVQMMTRISHTFLAARHGEVTVGAQQGKAASALYTQTDEGKKAGRLRGALLLRQMVDAVGSTRSGSGGGEMPAQRRRGGLVTARICGHLECGVSADAQEWDVDLEGGEQVLEGRGAIGVWTRGRMGEAELLRAGGTQGKGTGKLAPAAWTRIGPGMVKTHTTPTPTPEGGFSGPGALLRWRL